MPYHGGPPAPAPPVPHAPLPDRQDHRRDRDSAVRSALRKVRLLRHLRWPLAAETRFLDGVAAGRIAPPGVEIPPVPPTVPDAELVALQATLDRADPALDFLWRTVESARQTQALTAALGTADFVRIGVEMYGQPGAAVAAGAPSAIDGAHHFLAVTRRLDVAPPQPALDAAAAAAWMAEQTAAALSDPPMLIELDEGLASLATAGATRIRLRADARFSPLQLTQLLQHEALVHAATRRNGEDQPVLGALAIGPARTTQAQEGLATFAELITDCMDLHRLRRIALRVVALQMALEGADFVELWQWFREQGQSAEESYHSTRRILRGGDASPGHGVFAKDGVYVKGLLRLHAVLLASLREGDRQLPERLFLGRLSLGDAVRLRPLFEDGTLVAPARVPAWAAQRECLAAFLSFSALTTRFELDALSLAHFAETP